MDRVLVRMASVLLVLTLVAPLRVARARHCSCRSQLTASLALGALALVQHAAHTATPDSSPPHPHLLHSLFGVCVAAPQTQQW